MIIDLVTITSPYAIRDAFSPSMLNIIPVNKVIDIRNVVQELQRCYTYINKVYCELTDKIEVENGNKNSEVFKRLNELEKKFKILSTDINRRVLSIEEKENHGDR